MHSDVQPTVQTLASNLTGWCKRNIAGQRGRTVRWLKGLRAKRPVRRQSVYSAVSAVGIIAGATAAGLWLNSSAAGVFALVVLFLLASIAKCLQRIADVLRMQRSAALQPSWPTRNTSESNERSIYISSKAMERLRPWVEDQSTLTEESAKAYCSVLLDTLAMVDTRLAGKAHGGDIWS